MTISSEIPICSILGFTLPNGHVSRYGEMEQNDSTVKRSLERLHNIHLEFVGILDQLGVDCCMSSLVMQQYGRCEQVQTQNLIWFSEAESL